MSCQINLEGFYSAPLCFCGQFLLQERNFWNRYPFPWLFSWFKNWHFRPLWHIFATHWSFFSESLAISICEYINHNLCVSAVNLACWRANFEMAILFFDFFCGSKSDTLVSFATFLDHIGEFFLNELTNHFTSNLPFFFTFLQSIRRTREKILNSLSFCLTFFWFQE